VGYGHLCVEDKWVDGWTYSQVELEDLLEKDLQSAIDQANDMCKDIDLHEDAKNTIIEMIFQLGGSGVKKFRNMWAALRETPPNYLTASIEMLDSKWAKQTPGRAKEMSDHMKGCA
jgi:lysozyme